MKAMRYALYLTLIAIATVSLFVWLNVKAPMPDLAGATKTGRVGPADIYEPAWATGALDLETSGNIGQTICNKNWSTKQIRPPTSYTNKLKLAQMKKLGLTGSPADYEEDHLVSLEIGGSPTSTLNLWPEPYKTSIPNGGAKEKDKVENYLHQQICAGKMSPYVASRLIVNDWYKIYRSLP